MSNQKRILLINHYAGSPRMGMEFRPYYLSKEWVKMGYKVDIIAADYSHLRLKNPSINCDFEIEEIEGITYHWIKTRRYEGNGIKRAITMAQFVGKLLVNAKKISKALKPDVIITSSTYPLDTYAGQRIKKYSGATLIHEVHDMWPITPIELYGMSKWHPFVFVMQIAENSFCKKSDKIVSLLPHAKEYLMQHGMDMKKFYHVSNGIVEKEWEQKEALPYDLENLICNMKKENSFVLCFFGSHTKSYALSYLIEAVKKISAQKIGLLFIGEGNIKAELMEEAKESENIHFYKSIPKKSIPSLCEAVDAIYVGAINNRMFRFGICMNKLFDSMMGGKPILYAVNAPNNYIAEYSCGISVEPESVEELVKGIDILLSMSEEQLSQLGKNGKKAVLENFTYSKLAEKFAEIF